MVAQSVLSLRCELRVPELWDPTQPHQPGPDGHRHAGGTFIDRIDMKSTPCNEYISCSFRSDSAANEGSQRTHSQTAFCQIGHSPEPREQFWVAVKHSEILFALGPWPAKSVISVSRGIPACDSVEACVPAEVLSWWRAGLVEKLVNVLASRQGVAQIAET